MFKCLKQEKNNQISNIQCMQGKISPHSFKNKSDFIFKYKQ